MANKKFSEFVAATEATGFQLVGLQEGINKRLAFALLPFIPLSGTEEGKPVTGDVEFEDADASGPKKIWGKFANNIFEILFSDEGSMKIRSYDSDNPTTTIYQAVISPTGFVIETSEGDTFSFMPGRGIVGSEVFTPAEPQDYVQMQHLPAVDSNFANDAAAAAGGIAVGGMYHTAGVVKIRLS